MLLVGAIVVIVAVLAAYWFVTQGPGQQLLSPRGSTVAEFSGDGDQTTSPFQVREGWAIHWDSTAAHFAFAIRGDRDFGTIIDIDEPGSGVTSPTGSGSYNLEITADGPWSIRITQGE